MTCIATDGKTIAADSRCSFDKLIMDDSVDKLERGKGGAILGTAGETGVCGLVREWWAKGGPLRTLPDIKKVDADDESTFHGLILYADGRVAYMDPHFTPVAVRPPFAVGSGAQVAIGAMLAGATPAEAIEFASRVVPSVGGTIIEWKPTRKRKR